jgi:hypothetical protein
LEAGVLEDFSRYQYHKDFAFSGLFSAVGRQGGSFFTGI